jgi:hypothetical protein
MNQPDQMTLTFRCPPGLETIIPRSRCAWCARLVQGAVIPLAVDLKVQNGEFSWEFDPPIGRRISEFAGRVSPSESDRRHAVFEDDRFIIKFNNFSRAGKPAENVDLESKHGARPDESVNVGRRSGCAVCRERWLRPNHVA